MEAWQTLLAAGIAGFGLGAGLVVGAFVARSLRRYMRSEDLGSRRDDPPNGAPRRPD